MKTLERYQKMLVNIFNEYKEKELILRGNNDTGFMFDVRETNDLDLINWVLNEANERLMLIASKYLAREVMGFKGRVTMIQAFNVTDKDQDEINEKLIDYSVALEQAIEESGIDVIRD